MKTSLYRIALTILTLMSVNHAAAADRVAAVSASGQSDPTVAPSSAGVRVRHADFAHVPASTDARRIAHWVVDSNDNSGLPFVILDKTHAKLFIFDAAGVLRGATPALLGLARGDHTVPGIGNRELSKILPSERTTPAGRFVAERGMSTRGEDIIWVDYDSAVSLHRVVTTNAKERRLERLATPTAADNRISLGCINVPVAFYNTVVRPTFANTNGIFYVLPEVRPLHEVFAFYDVDRRGPGGTPRTP